ncbi:hypothetical protein D3C75_645760 [compost metagenome]
MLGGDVEDATAARVEGAVGQGEDHAAAGLAQRLGGAARAEQVALHVDREQALEGTLEVFRGDAVETGEIVEHRRVADEGVELAEGLQGGGDRLLVVLVARHVALHDDDGVAQLVLQLLQLIQVARHHADARALLHVAAHDGAADPTGTAGNQRHLPF